MIRKAVMEDIKDIMEIIKQTIAEMRTYNNTQWNENYPQEKDFIDDIQSGNLFASEVEGKLAGFVCLNKEEPVEYSDLNWSLKQEAMVIHRMAVNPDFRRRGIGTELMKFAEKHALENNIQHLKTDTYSINTKMNGLFKKCGLNFIGEVHFYENEKPFYCYEKVLIKVSLSTERLVLKCLTLPDTKAMFKYRSNPEIYKFQNWKPHTIQEVEDFICANLSKEINTPDNWYQFGIFIKESNKLIGDLGVHFIDADNVEVEIGYTLSKEYQGLGYASEAVTGVITYLFHNLNKHRIIASVDPENTKSIALLERIGMRKEAHFKKSIWFNEKWVDDIVYAILEEEWKM